MILNKEEKDMLNGKYGYAVQKSMEILVAIGEIYEAKRMVPIVSAQIAGVSYDNLGDAGIEFLEEISKDAKVRVITTLNPAGMDLEDWKKLGISDDFAEKQLKIIKIFSNIGVIPTCTCTPYFVGNTSHFGQHVAWSESSAVIYGNSVIGLYTNREGGPSALAAAITGRTPYYGYHLDENRQAKVKIIVEADIKNDVDFGILGKIIGQKIKDKVCYITGIKEASVDKLKIFGASLATYGGASLFHIEGITPNKTDIPKDEIVVSQDEIFREKELMSDVGDVDFISLGCPHASLEEVATIASLLKNKKVKKELWICTSRSVYEISKRAGYVRAIEDSGAKFAVDSCMVVAPIKGRFKAMATNSAKAAYYAKSKNNFKVLYKPLEECIKLAIE
ncbi:MAG: aconitase X catalytic domain-containing protein [Candidatus Diapherotrites archaeon]|nr:aconitase X catalytic domain-containing protein [Candidatus Diapherotrites archaeon]